MDEANSQIDEQALLLMKQEDFEAIRIQNHIRYKAILKQYIKIYQPQNLQEFAMCIIKKPSEERNEDEINILQQWTSRFKFFEDLNRKQVNVELKLHHKCCSRIKYENVTKGTAIFQAGDIPEKFYIVLSGSVNVMLPKSKEQLAQEVINEKNRIKGLKTSEIKNSIWHRINQIKERREQIKMSRNYSQQQSASVHHNPSFFKIPSMKRVDSQASPSPSPSPRQNFFQDLSFSSVSPRNFNHRVQNSSKFDPAFSNQSDEVNVTTSNVSEHLDQSKLNNSFVDESRLKNLNFMMKLPAKDSILSEKNFNKRGSIFNDIRQRQESNVSDLQIPLRKQDSSSDVQASLFKRDNTPDQITIDLKSIDNNSEAHSEEELRDGQQQQEESLNEIVSTLKLDGNNHYDENDPAYQLLGNIQLEAIQDLDCFFQEGVLKYKYLLTLNPGSMFGELGLLLKKPRAATILAREDTEFAILNANDFCNILSVGEMRQINRRLQFFAENFLQGCGKEIVTKYSYNFKCVKYSIGNFIYKQGDPSQFVYIIKKGFVETRVIKKKQNLLDKANSVSKMLNTFKKQESQSVEKLIKEKVCLSQISVGQCFGEIEVIKNMPRISHAICMSNKVALWELPATKLITENKFLYQQFLDQIKLKEQWYQRQEVTHDLQKEIKAEISGTAKDQQQQQAKLEQIEIRKQKLKKEFTQTNDVQIKGQDEEIEKHIKLELLKEELEKDLKFLNDLKQMNGEDFLKKQELIKNVEIIGVKKQLNMNQIHKLQKIDDQFEQKVFKVMQKIEYQKKQMKDLIRKIMIQNSYKYMPKFKLNEFIGMDIKHALNLKIFSSLQNQVVKCSSLKTNEVIFFRMLKEQKIKIKYNQNQEYRSSKNIMQNSNYEPQARNFTDKQVDQLDLASELLENNFEKQITQNSCQTDRVYLNQSPTSQKFNVKQDFKINLDQVNKQNQMASKFKLHIPHNSMDSSPFSIRSSKSLLNQHKIIGNQAGIGSFQKYFQTCKTAREKIATAQKQEQNVMQANNIQQQQQNSQMSLQIFQSSPIITPRTLQTQSNRQSQRLSFNFSNLNNYEQESAKQSRSKQRDQVLYFNDYNIIQQNIHNKQMDNHSQIFTVKPFFYTKNQQNVEVMKALPEKNKIREKNKDHSNFQNSDGLKNFTKHQKSNTTNLNEINREYFFKTSEELINFYNLNTSRKDLKRQTFQSTSETFRKNSEQEQQKIFQNQSQFVKNFNTIYDNLNEKVFEDLRPDNFFKIQTINDENFQSFHSINTNIQSNLDPKLTFDKQKSSIAENQRNIIRSQSNPNITQNCMQFNRKYSNQKLNQSPILTNLQEIKLKTTPPISLIEKPLTQREARFKLSINSHKNSIDTLASQDQLYQKEVKNIQRPISPILLQNDSYDEKNFYRQKLQQNTHKKIKSQLLSKTEESILNESIQQQDIQNMDLQQSFCQSIQSCNQQQLNSKQVSLSNSPRKLNFVQMNRNATKFINKQNANNSKKKTDINPICFQEYKDIDEQEPKYNQEDILKQIIKCRQKLKPKNQMTKETKQDKLVKIKKQLLNYQESSTDLQNIQTSKESSDMTQQQNKKSSKQIIAKKESLVKEQFDYIQSSTGYSFYPNFDEVQNQKSLSSSNQQTNTLQNYEKSPPIYNQNSFTSTKHNMFRQKPQKLFLLHNSTNYQKIQKIESIIKNNKNENIK